MSRTAPEHSAPRVAVRRARDGSAVQMGTTVLKQLTGVQTLFEKLEYL